MKLSGLWRVVLLLFAGSLHAQETVSVRGSVVDRSGAPVSDAPVELDTANGQVRAQAVSGQNGSFALGPVSQGSYILAVPPVHGFAAQQRTLRVTASTAPVKLVLVPETVTQTIDVGGPDPLSTQAAANQDTVAISAGTLDHLPVFDQDIVTTLSSFLDPSATSSSGVSIVVDGMEMKAVNVSASAIADVRINSDPYSAEFSSPGRGRLEITTKPGSPHFHGTLNFIARDAVFNAKNYFAPTKPAEQRRIYEGHLTGPVGHGGHTTFLLSGTRQEEDLETAVHAIGPSGLIAENTPTPNRASMISGRVTRDLSAAHRIAVTYNFRLHTSHAANVGGIVLPEAGIDAANRQDQILFNDRILVSPAIVQQLQLLLERETDSEIPVTDAQSIQVSDSFTGGGAQFSPYRTEHTVGIIDVVSWTRGKHYWRFGVNIPQISRRAVDDTSNRLGTFFFNSLADYENHTPYNFTIQQGRGRATYFATEIATFVQDEMTLRKNLQMTLGVRYQWSTYFTAHGNFAPRLSLAWSPATKWVVRGGAGIFMDRIGGDFPVTFKLHNGVNLLQYQILNPGFPNPLPPGITYSSLPPSIVREPANMGAAYQAQYSAGIERQLAPGLSATATYRGITGIKAFRSRDANAPLPPYTSAARPNPALGFVQQVESEGRSRMNALDLGLHGRAGTWFEGQAQYTWSHAWNNTGGQNWYPQDQYNPNAEWGRSDLDRRERLNLLGTLRPGHWLSAGLALTLYSGLPYTELAGTDVFHTGLGNARPAAVGRNTLQGGGSSDVDLLWDHDFHLNRAKGENARLLNLGISAFNLLNHPNFANYIGNVRSALYQQPTTALPGRQMQFGLRYQF